MGFVVHRRTGEAGGGERYPVVGESVVGNSVFGNSVASRWAPPGPRISPSPGTARQCRRRGRAVLSGAWSGSAGSTATGRAEADQGRRRLWCSRQRGATAVVGACPGADGIVLGRRNCRCGTGQHRPAAAARRRPCADPAEPSPRCRDSGHGRQDHSGPPGSRGDLRREHERCCQQTGSTESPSA